MLRKFKTFIFKDKKFRKDKYPFAVLLPNGEWGWSDIPQLYSFDTTINSFAKLYRHIDVDNVTMRVVYLQL